MFSIQSNSGFFCKPSYVELIFLNNLIMCFKEICSWVLINTFDQLFSISIIHHAKTKKIMKINRLLTDSQLRCRSSVDRISIECRLRCWSSVDWVSFEMSIKYYDPTIQSLKGSFTLKYVPSLCSFLRVPDVPLSLNNVILLRFPRNNWNRVLIYFLQFETHHLKKMRGFGHTFELRIEKQTIEFW